MRRMPPSPEVAFALHASDPKCPTQTGSWLQSVDSPATRDPKPALLDGQNLLHAWMLEVPLGPLRFISSRRREF
jgi:hypothetical protein